MDAFSDFRQGEHLLQLSTGLKVSQFKALHTSIAANFFPTLPDREKGMRWEFYRFSVLY